MDEEDLSLSHLVWPVGLSEAEQHSDRWGAQLVYNL